VLVTGDADGLAVRLTDRETAEARA
jgi:hypothetical protein